MGIDSLLYQLDAGVARITLNRPDQRNALNSDLISALPLALEKAANDENVRVVLISGAGKDFCAGLDLRELDQNHAATLEHHEASARKFAEIILAIRRHPHPVVAAVQGRALAGGAGVATACDLVLAAQSASIGYPEVKVGFIPAVVSALLTHEVSEKRVFELFANGDNITAQEAMNIGLFNRVYPDAEFESSVNAYVKALAEKSATALSMTKDLLREMSDMTFEERVEAGIQANARSRMTEDAKRGFERFVKKS